MTEREASGPACWAQPRPWSIDQAGPLTGGSENPVFQRTSTTSVELPDRLPLPGALRIPSDVTITPLRGNDYALRGATTDEVRRITAQSLLELGFEVQEDAEQANGPVAGRWLLRVGGREGSTPLSVRGQLAAGGSVRLVAGTEGAFDIEAGASILVEPGARWRGSLLAYTDVDVADGAIIEGNIDCGGIVRLADGANVLGRVRCQRIILSRGARVAGGLVAGRTTPYSDSSRYADTTPLAPPHESRTEPITPWGPEPAPRAEPRAAHVAPAQSAQLEAPAPQPAPPIAATETSRDALELVLGVDADESKELLEALGIKRPVDQGRVIEIELVSEGNGLMLRRREEENTNIWERHVAATEHPLVNSLRDLLVRLGPGATARAEVDRKGAHLHLGPIDREKLPGAFTHLSGLVTGRTSLHAQPERRE